MLTGKTLSSQNQNSLHCIIFTVTIPSTDSIAQASLTLLKISLGIKQNLKYFKSLDRIQKIHQYTAVSKKKVWKSFKKHLLNTHALKHRLYTINLRLIVINGGRILSQKCLTKSDKVEKGYQTFCHKTDTYKILPHNLINT